ncbi:tetratricopeptide repeat protein [Nostoc linckia FACHB-104]|nr:tetratricopeptide repeat protein [Nostoc linckia FACHB-104]
MNKNIAIITSILLFQSPNFAITLTSKAQIVPQNSNCEIIPEKDALAGEFSEKQLETIASRITVKVIGDDNGGSGTLLAKKGNTYLVLTNSHVVRGVNSVKLKTVDGKTHTAQIVPNTKFEKFDLALLQFQSNEIYCPRNVEDVANFLPKTTMSVTAAGFSGEKGEIVFSHGKIQQISQPLKEGYQIGYTSNIEQGMSGGAIIDSSGILVGINGRGAYPILNSGYVYQNGLRPSESEIQEMRKLSWGIPISTVLAEVNADILTAWSLPLPLPETTASVPEPQLTGWLGDLEQKAKQFTVRIDSTSKDNGSGVIIAKNKNGNTYTYTVLTAAHVICERNKGDNATKPCRDENYEIVTNDGKKYSVDKSTIKREEGVDLAVVKFTATNENYQVASLADYIPEPDSSLKYENYMFTAGYPSIGDKSPWRFTVGTIADKDLGLLVVSASDFSTVNLGNLQKANLLTGGYELVYTSITGGGMSGGPVLDSMGRVIGIHGRAEAEKAYDAQTGECGRNFGCLTQIGPSLGIPIRTFLAIKTRLGVQPQKLEYTPALRLNEQQANSIKKILQLTDVANSNTTSVQWLERGNKLLLLKRHGEAIQAFEQVIKIKPSFVHLAYLGKGWTLADQEKYQEAQVVFEQAIRYKPDFATAWKFQSYVYIGLKQWDKALVAIEKTIQLQPNNPSIHLFKGIVLLNLQKYAEASTVIGEVIKSHPSALAYRTLAELYKAQNKPDLALANYNKAIEINPKSVDAYTLRGSFYASQQKLDLALADFKTAIELNPKSVDAYAYRGLSYFFQQKWDLALPEINKYIEFNPTFVEVYIVRAQLYTNQQKLDLALADYNKIIELNPKYAAIYGKRGFLYGQQQKVDLALADFKTAIELNPKSVNAYVYRGLSYLLQQKWDLALPEINKYIEFNPTFVDAYFIRAGLYTNQQRLDLALADYNTIIKLNPKEATYYNNRGLFYKDQKKWDLALTDYNKAIDINPQYANAYNNRGVVYENQKKWDLALADYNKAININPQYANALFNRGVFYYEQKQWELALADFTKAIMINPQDAQAYYYRGNLYYEQKKWDLAEADFTKAITINPQNAEAYYDRGVFYQRQKKWDLALADYNKAIIINPKDATYYNRRGLLYEQQDKLDLAEADLTKAIAINPHDATYYNKRGLIYKAQKKWDLAITDYNKAININPQYSNAYNNRGNIYYNQKKWDLALTDYNKAININPQYANALFNRGSFYSEKGEKQKAIQDLRQAAQLFKAQEDTAGYEQAMNLLKELQK